MKNIYLTATIFLLTACNSVPMQQLRSQIASSYQLAWDRPEDEKTIKTLIDKTYAPTAPNVLSNYLWSLYTPRNYSVPVDMQYNPTHIDYIIKHSSRSQSEFASKMALKDRSGDRLLLLYNAYKSFIFGLVPKSRFQGSGYDNMVVNLILSHQHITNQVNWKVKLDKIYKDIKMSEKHNQPGSPYPIRINQHTCSVWREFNVVACDSTSLWYYSFWLRRHKENNVNQVSTILNDMKKHYGI